MRSVHKLLIVEILALSVLFGSHIAHFYEAYEYVGVFSTVEDILSTVGVFSTVGDIMINVGGYHEYRGGLS